MNDLRSNNEVRLGSSTEAEEDALAAARPWSAHWIGVGDGAKPTGSIAGMDGALVQARSEVVLFSRNFTLTAVPLLARLRVTADSRYIVWLNGVEIARGPARFQPRRLEADDIEVASELRRGSNRLLVQVTYYGEANALWMPARTSGGLGAHAALLAELTLSHESIVTDEHWWVKRTIATTRLPRSDIEGIPAEVFDGRLAQSHTDAVDLSWSRAQLLSVGHIAGAGRSQPPADPYGSVPSHRTPMYRTATIEPRSVTENHARTVDLPAPEHPSAVVRTAEAPAREELSGVDVTTSTGGVFSYDFGRIVFGVVELTVDAPAGTVVDIDLREGLSATVEDVPHGLRYTCAEGPGVFASTEQHGFRVAVVRMHHESDPAAALAIPAPRITVRENVRDRPGGSTFSSADPSIDAIWAAGVRTVALNTTDSYIDCPTREQRAWVGDGVVHLEVDLYTNSDRTMARRYLLRSASPRDDGLLPMSVAGDIEAADAVTAPAWSLHWLHALHVYAMHEGVDDLVVSLLPVAERVLRWFVPCVDERGTLRDVPGWVLVDWSSVYTDGRSSILTALWVRGLREFAALSAAAQNYGAQSWAMQLTDAAREGFEDFWDEDRGLYLDRVDDGTRRSRAASQLGSATAILSGLAPHHRWQRIARAISDPERLITHSWLGRLMQGIDGNAFEGSMRHHPEPDWDVDRLVVRAEPFGASLVHDALGAAGCTEELLESIRRWSDFLGDGYDTFGEGWGWGSHAHGWSSSPTSDLFANILGIRPTDFGGATWRIEPRLGSLTSASGSVVTREGPLSVSVTPSEILITTPCRVEIVFGGRTIVREAGMHALTR